MHYEDRTYSTALTSTIDNVDINLSFVKWTLGEQEN